MIKGISPWFQRGIIVWAHFSHQFVINLSDFCPMIPPRWLWDLTHWWFLTSVYGRIAGSHQSGHMGHVSSQSSGHVIRLSQGHYPDFLYYTLMSQNKAIKARKNPIQAHFKPKWSTFDHEKTILNPPRPTARTHWYCTHMYLCIRPCLTFLEDHKWHELCQKILCHLFELAFLTGHIGPYFDTPPILDTGLKTNHGQISWSTDGQLRRVIQKSKLRQF